MKPNNIVLIIGASGVGKTTTCQKIKELNGLEMPFIHVDMDAGIADVYGENEEVVDYFTRVGMAEFQKNAIEMISDLAEKTKDNRPIMLIDVGAGATYGIHQREFTDKFHCLLLTADPKYLWENRDKPKQLHSSFDHYLTWQFNISKILQDSCQMSIDVSHLSVDQVSDCMKNKIYNYLNEIKTKKSLIE